MKMDEMGAMLMTVYNKSAKDISASFERDQFRAKVMEAVMYLNLLESIEKAEIENPVELKVDRVRSKDEQGHIKEFKPKAKENLTQ